MTYKTRLYLSLKLLNLRVCLVVCMLVDVLVVSDVYETDRQPYTRMYVLDSRWRLQIEHSNYNTASSDQEYNFEKLEEAEEKIILYLQALDSQNRTIYVYQDELDLFNAIDDELQMTVDDRSVGFY